MQRGPLTEPAIGLRSIEAVRLLDTDLPHPCIGGPREDVQAQHDIETAPDWRRDSTTGVVVYRERQR